MVYLSLCGFGNSVTSNCISITHLFPNSYFGSSLPSVCFDNSAWETQTRSELLPLCLYFSYLHESSCTLKYHWQALSCVAVNTPLIKMMWATCEAISELLALTLGVSVVSSSHSCRRQTFHPHFNTDFEILSLNDSLNDIDRIMVIDPQLRISLLQKLLGEKIGHGNVVTAHSTILKVPHTTKNMQ